MQEQDYILFEAYLSGSLDAESIQEFESRLQADTEFKVSFNDYQKADAFLEHHIHNEEQTQNFNKNLEQIAYSYCIFKLFPD